jgi:hypothetical protein
MKLVSFAFVVLSSAKLGIRDQTISLEKKWILLLDFVGEPPRPDRSTSDENRSLGIFRDVGSHLCINCNAMNQYESVLHLLIHGRVT